MECDIPASMNLNTITWTYEPVPAECAHARTHPCTYMPRIVYSYRQAVWPLAMIALLVLSPQQVAPRWWRSGRSCPAAMLPCTRSAHVRTASPSPSHAPSAVPSKPAPTEIPPRHTFGWCQLQEIVAPLMPRRFPSPSWGTDGCHAVYSPFWGLVGCQSLPPSRGAPVTSPFWGAPVTSSFCGASVPSLFWGATVPFPSVDLNIYSICVQICSGWKLNAE